MRHLSQYKLSSGSGLSPQLRAMHISDLDQLSEWLKALPYKRISDPTQLHLVMEEGCGTCSSKHAFFCTVALENGYNEFKLIIGIYRMNNQNTLGIGNVIQDSDIEYIPEAHCYVRFGDGVIDVTKEESIYDLIQTVLLEEQQMLPVEVVNLKRQYHKSYIKRWKVMYDIMYSEEELWNIREQCIENLVLSDGMKERPPLKGE